MTERHLDGSSHALSGASEIASNLASETLGWMMEHPKTSAILSLGVMGGAMILTHGEAGAVAKGLSAESKLPSVALGVADSGPGTVAGLFDDMVKSGKYTFVDGVMKPVGDGALKPISELPSTLLKADSTSPGTVAGLLDKLVTSGDYKVVGDPKSPFFILKPVGGTNQADIAAAEASFWKGK